MTSQTASRPFGGSGLRLARAAAVAALAAGMLLAGCGEDEEEVARQDIEETVLAYGESEDEEFCDFLSASALDQLGGESGCVQQFARVPPAELEVEEISLEGDEATVRVDNVQEQRGDTFELELVEQDGEWKVSVFPGLEPIAPEQAPLPPGEEPPPGGELPPPGGGLPEPGGELPPPPGGAATPE